MANPPSDMLIALTGLLSAFTGLIVAITALVKALSDRPSRNRNDGN